MGGYPAFGFLVGGIELYIPQALIHKKWYGG